MTHALRSRAPPDGCRAFDFRFTLTETYTFWSGMIGGLFLMLSYFGCDQSQVQRYLTAKSVEEATSSLLMSAYVKIPLQVLILLIGVLVFVFYLFVQPPMLFNPVHETRVEDRAAPRRYAELEQRFSRAFDDTPRGRDGATRPRSATGTPRRSRLMRQQFLGR